MTEPRGEEREDRGKEAGSWLRDMGVNALLEAFDHWVLAPLGSIV